MKDLTGNIYGRLLVIKRLGTINKKTWYECKCVCGIIKKISYSDLTSGRTKSCGCYKKEYLTKKNTTHGLSLKNGKQTRLFRIWNNIKTRVYNHNISNFKNYGGRGIKLCEEWHDFQKFHKWALENGYSKTLSIDRINVNGNYEPNNCRWVYQKVQANNTRRNKYILLNGITKTLKEWSEYYNINYRTVRDRLKRKWDIKDALIIPVDRRWSKCHS